MAQLLRTEVLGPWSLTTSRIFWEGFTPAALDSQPTAADVLQHRHSGDQDEIRTVFLVDTDWSRATARIIQQDSTAVVEVEGPGDLEAAAEQVLRFLSLDVDGRGWPAIGDHDPVIADAQQRLPGLRPCGFHSPYEAAVWAVLSQRIRIAQAARLRTELVARHGEDGAFPPPERLRDLALNLPGRKDEYLRAVAEAALDGILTGKSLRATDPTAAIRAVQEVKGLGPFAAELVVLRGANAPDALPSHEGRLDAEIAQRYPDGRSAADIAESWRPYRTWAAVHLRVLGEQRIRASGG